MITSIKEKKITQVINSQICVIIIKNLYNLW
jgi:hypothetical protein